MKSEIATLTTKIESIPPPKISAESLATTLEDPDSDFDVVLTGLESSMEAQLIKLFKRFSLPFKKANRRLRDMEDIGQQLESISVMGKAGIMKGKKGDIMVPTAHIFEGTSDSSSLPDMYEALRSLCSLIHVVIGGVQERKNNLNI